MMSENYWRQPLKWNRDAERAGVPAKVFCASMADVFEDHPDVGEPRKRLWDLIEETSSLRWQLLTKRPENVSRMVPESWMNEEWPSWVWLGVSAEDQPRARQRISILNSLPAQVRFVSAEPLLAPLDLIDLLSYPEPNGTRINLVDWLIAGGESGPKARSCELGWLRSLRDQCAEAETAFFCKQLGAVLGRELGAGSKGGGWHSWPEDLRIREFPAAAERIPA